LNAIDGSLEGLKKEYLNYLISLKELEEDTGIDLGRYPSFQEFQVIYEEEEATNV